jgi:hypothetical protein
VNTLANFKIGTNRDTFTSIVCNLNNTKQIDVDNTTILKINLSFIFFLF